MLNEIAKLKEELENEIGSLSKQEIAYFEQIKSTEDLKNFEDKDLIYDAAIALGLSDDEAEKIIGNDAPAVAVAPKLSEELTAKYQSLVRDVNLLNDFVYEAECQMVEEISAEGFASDTRTKFNKANADLDEAKRKLEIFKYENSSFVTRYKAMKKKEKEESQEEMFERFWNN